jgi:lactoylglutathione lyase
VIEYCAKLEEDGIEIWPDDWRTKFANPENRQMAFVTDPDGYEVEILPNQ